MSWLRRPSPRPQGGTPARDVPDGVWVKCDDCSEILYFKELERNLHICPKCDHHFRIRASRYIEILTDEGSFREMDAGLLSGDPLHFRDSKRYTDRLADARKKTGLNEAVVTGSGILDGMPVALGVMDFAFIGGSMASVVGEKLARVMKHGLDQGIPVIVVSASGGARMMEGILSLMQMAKTSVLLARLREKGIPYISILTDPTTGGVTASFASLGDVIFAEPGALIGFAGPRVIRETVAQELPPGFQRSEFLLEHGFVDRIVDRRELKATVGQILSILADARREAVGRGAPFAGLRMARPAGNGGPHPENDGAHPRETEAPPAPRTANRPGAEVERG